MRVLRQLCADERDRFPHAAAVVEHNTYMDDVCYSMPSLPSCLQLRDDLRDLLKAGGFELVKWASNAPELIETLPVSDRHTANINFEESETNLKVLGLQWSPNSDAFMFTVNIEGRPATKRNILSLIARQYDVLGLIAPVILYAKLILHVSGTQNISDCLSRGLSPAQLVDHPLWFTGPTWLCQEPCDWPVKSVTPAKVDSDLPESKKIVSLPITTPNTEVVNPLLHLATRVSSWLLLLRTVVLVYRFLKKLPRSKHFSADELEYAELQILKALQKPLLS